MDSPARASRMGLGLRANCAGVPRLGAVHAYSTRGPPQWFMNRVIDFHNSDSYRSGPVVALVDRLVEAGLLVATAWNNAEPVTRVRHGAECCLDRLSAAELVADALGPEGDLEHHTATVHPPRPAHGQIGDRGIEKCLTMSATPLTRRDCPVEHLDEQPRIRHNGNNMPHARSAIPSAKNANR
jgi:hypothetical protein